MTSNGQHRSEAHIIVYPPPSAADDQIKAIAGRRLAQIATALSLDLDKFKLAHDEGRKALDGGHDLILSAQRQRIVEALPGITDPLIRARVVELFGALSDDKDC